MNKKNSKVAVLIFTGQQQSGHDTTHKMNDWLRKEEGMALHEVIGGFKNETHFLDCLNELRAVDRSFELLVAMKVGDDSTCWPLVLKVHRMNVPIVVWSESTFLRSPCERNHVKFVDVRKENPKLGLERVFYTTKTMIEGILKKPSGTSV